MKGCVAKVPWKFKIVGALCFYSLVMFAYMPSTDRLLCAVAMFVSAVGDLFLGHVFSLKKYGITDFNMGAAAFGAAHLIYALAYVVKMKQNPILMRYINAGTGTAILICVTCLLLFSGICIYRKDYRYLWVIIAYVCLISVNCTVVLSYAWAYVFQTEICPVGTEVSWHLKQINGAIGAAVGVLSFLISDVCLGLNRVAGRKGAYKFVWIFYPIGQFLLITCG